LNYPLDREMLVDLGAQAGIVKEEVKKSAQN